MAKNNYLFYSEYLKGKSFLGKEILVSNTKTSCLIGPLLNKSFNNNSFYKRLTSNSIYSLKIYKRISYFKCKKIINKYMDVLSDNEVLEIFKDGSSVKHKIIKVPGENNE